MTKLTKQEKDFLYNFKEKYNSSFDNLISASEHMVNKIRDNCDEPDDTKRIEELDNAGHIEALIAIAKDWKRLQNAFLGE